MNSLFYAACFLAVLQSALCTMPTLAPRADQVASSHKGQSDEKCYLGCLGSFGNTFNPWLFGNSYLTYPYYGYSFGLNNGFNNLAYYTGGLGGGYGLFKKDASEPNKHQETSA
ncbi:hypothetical protein PGT21_019690 [Puccinia graminis f. sp. tritici]|uniref:Uncharacterized protein n=1 Tax=Puccinia graminis f. sp. tritici TaxID=56615 RepID=A0A5B0MLD9_PUCGR|nr:hypothetical protein PGT21_019690 [Puccinia graminis f. sp. tritici]KAA1126972.1 hypothetical protein PGTUg99_034285 [Puccinia graminis f. sp. tritici]